MSDSESDLAPSNVFTFQNENTMISAKGPSVNRSNITNLNFRNVMTSTMNMPRNFERQHYAEPSFDQRSMYYRRETSPVSMYSGSDMRTQNFHQSYYRGGMGSQSTYYRRGGSPMSMRSMDSNASASAVDIALAFKNEHFNKHDLRMIKDAYNKFMKRRIRKKIEKRRNMRLYQKGYRPKSGYDSGEQGSDSSISSDDDCKSTRSAMYRDDMSCRTSRTDLSDFRRTIMNSNMYKDCTDNLKQNAFKNMLSLPSAANNFLGGRFNAQNPVQDPPAQHQNEFAVPKQPLTQKERFKSGYLLPSQRFNKSVASMPLNRDPRLQARHNIVNTKKTTNEEPLQKNRHISDVNESDQEEIFSEITVRENTTYNFNSRQDKLTEQGKRGLENEDSNKWPDRKKPKLSTPEKQPNKAKDLQKECKTKQAPKENKKIMNKNEDCEESDDPEPTNYKKSDFDFLKPQFPVRKSGPAKPKEKLISKSRQPLPEEILPPSRPDTLEEPAPNSTTAENQVPREQPDSTKLSNSDLSMRPSFIKRKLFTQKMDVTEKKNLSSDNLNVNSPQTNVYSAIQKEKKKARKLVTNQSCLSRDIAQEGDNLLDLIHKIVPADRMNLTNVTNKTSISTSVSSKNPINDDDKWDVTSVISTCIIDDCSETYTDEEIFGADDNQKKISDNNRKKDIDNKPKENNKNHNKVTKSRNDIKMPDIIISKPVTECKILVEKLQPNKMPSNTIVKVNKTAVPVEENDYNNKRVHNCVKSFWDTDFESDLETLAPKRPIYRTENVKQNQNKCIVVEEPKPISNKIFNVSLMSVSSSIKSKTMPTNNLLRKFNISKTLSIKSFLTPKQVKSKPKIDKENQKDHQKERNKMDRDIPKTEDPLKHINTEPEKKSTKQIKNPKRNNLDIEAKKAEPRKGNTKNNGDLLTSTKKTESKMKSNVDEGVKKSGSKNANTKNNGDILKTTAKQAQPNKKSRSPKSRKENANNSVINNSIAERLVRRTPKRKACCAEPHDDHNRVKSSLTKSPESKTIQKCNSNEMKLSGGNSTKGRAAQNKNDNKDENAVTNKTVAQSKSTLTKVNSVKVSRNNKKVELEIDEQNSFDNSKMNRTLRSCRLRRINLSSSVNSSTENVTLPIRSLRTRQVDLSNSLKNSSLDETIKKRPRTNAVSKKVPIKPTLAEVNNKKPRSVNNRSK